MGDDRVVVWAGFFERYGFDEHHALDRWAHNPVAEANALRIVKAIGALVVGCAGDEAELEHGADVLGVNPEVAVLRARRWLRWYDADRVRQREAAGLVGVEVATEGQLPWRWSWRSLQRWHSPADRRPVVHVSDAGRPEWVERPKVRELWAPMPLELGPPEPRALPSPQRALPAAAEVIEATGHEVGDGVPDWVRAAVAACEEPGDLFGPWRSR